MGNDSASSNVEGFSTKEVPAYSRGTRNTNTQHATESDD